MRDATIAKNYAEAFLELARRHGGPSGLDQWGLLLDEVATATLGDETLRLFLQSPRVGAAEKSAIIGKAFESQLPRNFVRFLQALVMHRRQMLVPEIAKEYHDLVDAAENRVHAAVTVAKPVEDAERGAIAARLSKSFGKEVIAHYYVNPAILGGVIVRVGDTVLDGSVRRKLGTLKARMLAGR